MHRHPTSAPPRRRRVVAGTLLVALALGMVSGGARSADDEGPSVHDTRVALEQWVENRRLIAKVRHQWELDKQTLGDRIAMLRADIAHLEEDLESSRADIGEADELLQGLRDEKETLHAASRSVADVVDAYEARTRKLLQRFPAPLQDNLRMLTQLLSDDPEADKPSLSQRFLTIVGILDEANRFHREITASHEVRTLSDGTTAEVTALYVGLAAAYYANAAGTAGGVGAPTAEGWSWRAADAAAPRIAEAIRVHQGEIMARFVQLPIDLTEGRDR